MRLVTLTIRNFRGYGNAAEPIPLDGDLLLFFGPNGFGKTSLAEAIEWLFYGTTKRRLLGDTYSRSEYANSFANIHGGAPTEVTATVLVGGRRATISRRLSRNETSETYVDGIAGSFSTLGIVPIEAFYPVVAQHGLQTFVHSKPKDRRDAICAAFGLDELTALKNALESARLSFQRTPPHSVASARRELAANARVLSEIAETRELARRWQTVPLQLRLAEDTKALLHAAEALTGVECVTVDDALNNLREKRLHASRSVFDASKIAPNNDVLANLQAALAAVVESMAGVERSIAAAAAAMASTYKTAFLEFWKRGLELSRTGDACPMCEEDTLTTAKREEIAKRLAENAGRIQKNEALVAAVSAAKSKIATYAAQASEFGVVNLSAEDIDQLRRLFSATPEDMEAFLPELEAFEAARTFILGTLDVAKGFLDGCTAQLEAPEKVTAVVEESARLKDVVANTTAPATGAHQRYIDAWHEFEPKLAVLISSNEIVARIDAVGKSLRLEPSMRILDRYEDVLEEAQELIRSVEAEMLRRQGALLATRGAEVKALYDRLNKGADVVFESMEPGTDSMKLNATSFGARMSAAANLSECQLNCLGLSMWLMRATTPSSSFGFVVLDDPVQSMDDDHTEAFIADVVPHLLDQHGKQVIVLSHVKKITERLRELNLWRNYRLFHFDSYMRGGPAIVEQIALQKRLAEVKGAARGNEENRAYAVDRMRVLTEHFIRELHLKVMGAPVPSQYDSARASQLFPVFQGITGTMPDEVAKLRDTVQFCDPAHHSEVGYAVPTQTNIQPHISRLESLMKKYGLIS